MICQDASLWEAINCFSYFEVNISIEGFGSEVILVNGGLWEDVQWDFHVFKLVHWCAEVEVFDVKAKVACVSCADDAVQQDFCCGEVSHLGGELSWVGYKVTPSGESDVIGICFLRAIVGISDCAVS